MTPRGILACVVLLCVASAADAQRFGPIRFFRPPPPPVARPVAPVPVLRPTVGPTFTATTPSAGTFTTTTSTDSKPSEVDYTKPIPATKAPSDGGWWVLGTIAMVLVVVIFLCAIAVWANREKPDAPPLLTAPPQPPPPTVLVRIVAVPEGEAPEWVRQAWVGLVLPAVDQRLVRGQEVLSGRRSFAPAYQVSSTVALELLEMGNKTAVAEWWRVNTPAAVVPGEVFLFEPTACQVV